MVNPAISLAVFWPAIDVQAMDNQYFFGYGSLVNRTTHDYQNCALATVSGWRRAWVSTDERPFAYLSVIRDDAAQTKGLIAQVPGGDWAALDEREAAYDRIDATQRTKHTHPNVNHVAIYSVPNAGTKKLPILLSYLDVVLQGYLAEFGEVGPKDFIDTTTGWDTPILDDRATPHYPRHRTLSSDERSMVDTHLRSLNVEIFKA